LSQTVLETKGICRSFGKKEVLRGIDLKVESGQRLALNGRNGAGKTTFLRVLAAQLIADAGKIYFNNQEHPELTSEYRAKIGYMPSLDNSFFPRLTGLENLRFFSTLNHVSDEVFANEIERWRQYDVFAQALSTNYAFCSNGMKQILALFRALCHGPQLLLLDEPERSLDRETVEILSALVRDFSNTEQNAVLFISHNSAFTDNLATESVTLEHGLVV
jgi:ABC-type multidrug transport system ATPase subunit